MADREFTAVSFYLFLSEGRLMATRCSGCGALCIPPKPLCAGCRSCDFDWLELSGNGRIAAFTAIAVAPSFMVQEGFGRDNPYVAAVVELAEGVRISARLLGLDAQNPELINIGTPVKLELPAGANVERPVLTFRAIL